MKSVLRPLVVLLTITFGFFTSCDSEDDTQTEEFTFSAENNVRAAQADNAVEGSLNIIDNGFVETAEARNNNTLFPECTTITLIANGDSGTITLDFGTGCVLNNGATVSGEIELEYGPLTNGARTINYTFSNYTYNAHGVIGGGQIVRQLVNSNGNPQSQITESITISFANSEITATRTGTILTEWVEGFGSGTWDDNVYEFTGNWNLLFNNNFNRNCSVTQALVKKSNCLYVVEGLLDVTQNNISGTLDYGDGECDNIATIEIFGETYELLL